MNNAHQLSARCRKVSRGLWLILALCSAVFANAENLLKNPDFESPLSTNDWIVQFSAPGIPSTNAYGGPGDFAIADRTTEGSRIAGGYGGHFRSRTDWTTRAYFTQTASSLTNGATYHLSGYMRCTMNDDKFRVCIEAVGGSGSPTDDGRFSVRTPDAVTNKPPTQYFLDQTPDTNGRIEVRLLFEKRAMKPGDISYPKFTQYSAYFDDFVLTP